MLRVIAVLIALASPAVAADVEMMRMPGTTDKSIPMPSAALRAEIERRMESGEGMPEFVEVPASRMNAECRARGDLLGCVRVEDRLLGQILIRRGLSGKLTAATSLPTGWRVER